MTLRLTNNDIEGHPLVWVYFLDSGGKETNGFFHLLELSTNYVKVANAKLIYTIPTFRIIKLVEGFEDGRIPEIS